jgi:hypothetical protein
VKQEIAMAIVAGQRAGEMAKKRAEEINAAARKAASLEEALSQARGNDPAPLKVEETGPFPKREFIPRLGLAKDISNAAWKLTKDAPVPETPFETENAWVVVRMKERLEPTEEEFVKEKTMAMLSASYQKRNGVVRAWTEQLRKTADVAVHPLALSYDDEARAAARRTQ